MLQNEKKKKKKKNDLHLEMVICVNLKIGFR